MLILGLLGVYFDAAVVFVKRNFGIQSSACEDSQLKIGECKKIRCLTACEINFDSAHSQSDEPRHEMEVNRN